MDLPMLADRLFGVVNARAVVLDALPDLSEAYGWLGAGVPPLADLQDTVNRAIAPLGADVIAKMTMRDIGPGIEMIERSIDAQAALMGRIALPEKTLADVIGVGEALLARSAALGAVQDFAESARMVAEAAAPGLEAALQVLQGLNLDRPVVPKAVFRDLTENVVADLFRRYPMPVNSSPAEAVTTTIIDVTAPPSPQLIAAAEKIVSFVFGAFADDLMNAVFEGPADDVVLTVIWIAVIVVTGRTIAEWRPHSRDMNESD